MAVSSSGSRSSSGADTDVPTSTVTQSPSVETVIRTSGPAIRRAVDCAASLLSPRIISRVAARAPPSTRSWVTPAAIPVSTAASQQQHHGRHPHRELSGDGTT